MGIRESALNTITALTNGDFVRMVTAAGASRKASLQSIAQHIIENYTGSTLAGSSQSVKAAIDGLNSTTVAISQNSTYLSSVSNASYRSGKVVVLNFYFKNSTAIPLSTTIATVSGLNPGKRVDGMVYESGNFLGGVYISTTGEIKTNVAIGANIGWRFVTLTYIAV